MNIDVTYDASVANAPTGFTTVVADVVQFYDSQFADPITLNIDVGWGEVDGQSLDAKALGESDSNYTATSYDYAQIRAALTSSAVTAEAAGAVATLPTADPTGGGVFSLTTAEAKALGLAGASAAPDGWVGFSGAPGTFDFSVTQNGGAVATNEYDLFGVVAHEFSEVMGRQMNFGAHGDVFEPLDMFDYSAPAVRSFNASAASRYYSVDGGVSDMFDFNTDPKGDLFDFSAGDDVADAFDAFAPAGVVNPVGIGDLTLMDVIGYVPTPIFAIAGPSLNGETLSFQIADQSQGPAPASAAGIYVSTNLDAAPTTADTLLASYSTPAIAGGGSAHATTVLPLSTLAPGAYILDVIADANGAVVQSSSRSDASNRLAIGILDNANLTALQADQLSNFDLAGLDLTGFFSFNDLYVAAAVNGPGTLEAGGTVVFGPGASLSVAEFRVFSGTEVDVQTDLAYAGFWNQQLGPVRVDAGSILDLTGSGNVIESAIGGPGALAFSGGSTAFGSYGGSTNNSLTVANVAVSGPTTQVSVAINLAYAGAWTQGAGTLT
ncbi:MAG TPA: NF038122 family metalloprotease, partial [Caulobacteraceae bacterium]|nr:NF038122 family metalloprotease [Caulobacteraceae bacterium]